jgi:PAS domain S-box-containing protein
MPLHNSKSREELKESEEFYRLLFDEAPVGYHKLDREGRIANINNTELKILGYSAEEMIGKYVWTFIINEEVSKKAVLAKLSGKLPPGRNFERTFRKKDGTTLLALVDDRILFDKEGKIAGLLTAFQDITERNKAEEEILKLYRAIESSGEVIFLTNKNGLITYINPTFTKIYGYSIEEIVGQTTPRILKSNKINKEKYEKFWKIIISGNVATGQIINKTKDGRLVEMEGSANAVFDKKGNIIGFLAIQRDVTERNKAELQLKKYAEELKTSNATKDKFFSIIAHDLRGAFNVILGYSEFLYDDFDDLSLNEIKKYTSNIYDTSKNTFKLFDNLLEWARMQMGRTSFNPVTFDICEIIREVIMMSLPIAQTKNIKLESRCDKECKVFADDNMIRTVLRNLLSNAIKFTQTNGTVNFEINSTKEYAEIKVSDSGMGISEENLGKLFKIDSDFSTLGTAEEKGTGLGLHLCKEFVEKCGGTIRVESVVAKGTSFYFTLPKNKPE